MLKTKSLHEPYGQLDGKRILVSYYWPTDNRDRQIDIWFQELGSPLELIKNWKTRKLDFDHFVSEYQKILQHKQQQIILKKIAEESHYNNVTLLCHCKKASICHRLLVKKYIEDKF